MDSNHAVSQSFMALGASTRDVRLIDDKQRRKTLHSTICHLDPLTLKNHQLSGHLVVSSVADILDNFPIEDRCPQSFDEECSNVIRSDKWWKEFQRLDLVQSWTMP